MDSQTLGALLTFGCIFAAVGIAGLVLPGKPPAVQRVIDWNLGLTVAVALTVPVLLIFGWTQYAELRTGEDRARAEQHQRELELVGPPGPQGMDGRDGVRVDRCSACGVPGRDGEPFAKPRDDR